AAVVLRTPTLIWIFVGGALVTFAVNGLIAWAATFMGRVHGFTVVQTGQQFGVWGLAGGVLGAVAGGRLADRLQERWSGGRVLASGSGFVIGGPLRAALVLVDDLRLFAPQLFWPYCFSTCYYAPRSAGTCA